MSSQARARNPDQAEESQASSDNLITQEHSLQLVENLRKFYEDEYCFLYDVKLVSRDGGQVRAHRVILAAQSDYFKVMVCHGNIINYDYTLQSPSVCSVLKRRR